METLDSVDNSVENLQHLLPNPNVLVAVSKGHVGSKALHQQKKFLTGGAS